MSRRIVIAAIGALAVWGGVPHSAAAADRLYWTQRSSQQNPGAVAAADTTGANGGVLNAANSQIDDPYGTAIDPVTGRVYFADFLGDRIAYVSIDGSGGGVLNTGAATVNGPTGVSIDPVTRRIYWANPTGIGWARLDGSGGGMLDTTGTPANGMGGVAVDRATGRIWWTSGPPNAGVYYANLDGSGGAAQLDTTGAPLFFPRGIAVDHVSGRVYWTNSFGIAYANIDGSGGGGEIQFDNEFPNLNLTGLAIDQPASHLYFPATDSDVMVGSGLDGSDVGEIVIDGVTVDGPAFPSLLKVPVGAGPPAISGGPNVGSTLSCTQGDWVADAVEAFRWQMPFSYAYRWTRDGEPIAGATSSTLTADEVGTYRCEVTGTNPAGSATQVSEPITIAQSTCPDVSAKASGFTPRRKRVDRERAPGVRARVTVSQRSRMKVDASIVWKDGGRRRTTGLGSRTLVNNGRRNLPFPIPNGVRDALPVGSRVTLKLSIVATPTADPDCVDPGTFKAALKTRVAIVNDPGG